MRFCTTHRACAVGNHADDPFCEVASVWPSWLPLNSPEPCTLVDALIVPKEDGQWPDWATEITILDALYEAAKETP